MTELLKLCETLHHAIACVGTEAGKAAKLSENEPLVDALKQLWIVAQSIEREATVQHLVAQGRIVPDDTGIEAATSTKES